MHLRYSMPIDLKKHPLEDMKDLGITYQHKTPQTIGEQWWFWNCENIPEKLPEYINKLVLDPFEAIGYGLDKEMADKISNYKKQQRSEIMNESTENLGKFEIGDEVYFSERKVIGTTTIVKRPIVAKTIYQRLEGNGSLAISVEYHFHIAPHAPGIYSMRENLLYKSRDELYKHLISKIVDEDIKNEVK